MDLSQEDIGRCWEAHRQSDDKKNITLCIKLRVSNCFCREHHAPEANRLIDDFLVRHPIDPAYCEYIEHESGPEVLVHLQVLSAGLTLAAGSIALLAAIVNLVTAIVSARSAGARKGDSQHGPLAIVVRGISPNGVFYESEVLEAELEAPPAKQTVEESLTNVIEVIAKERARREIAELDKQPVGSKKTKRAHI